MTEEDARFLADVAGVKCILKPHTQYNFKTGEHEGWYFVFIGDICSCNHRTKDEAFTCAWNRYAGHNRCE